MSYIGTVLYEMIVGSPPYYDDDLKTMYRNIDEGNLIFPLNMSVEAQDLIRVIMTIYMIYNNFSLIEINV